MGDTKEVIRRVGFYPSVVKLSRRRATNKTEPSSKV